MGTRDTTARLPESTTEATAPLDSFGQDRLVLDRYRLIRKLGTGGFGVVWLAYDETLERDVAVKVVPRGADPSGDERVRREARTAARLAHPGIVAVYELAADEHHLYLVSELVRGRTLAELTKARALADRDVARIGAALCEALDHAHARGVIHRDVKPGNAMVVADPAAGSGFAKLADFGVAHVASGDPITATGDVVGTLAYMAPEQADGRQATPASDVYSLALTLYEAWTGANPLRASSAAATARRIGHRLPPLGRQRRDLPVGLCETIDAALHPDPLRRPTPGVLRRELDRAEHLLADEGGLLEPETLARVGLPRGRRRLWGRGHRLPVADERPRRVVLLAQRLGAGAAAGGLVLAALAWLGPPPPFSPLAAAGAAALAVALLPRIGWLAAALGLCGWLASPEAGREGTALLLAAALAPVPLLLPRAGAAWSLPALAPLLAMAGLGPAFVALAGLARSGWRRAGLGAAGFLWLAATEALTGSHLLFGSPDGTLPRADWQGSTGAAISHALGPLLTSPALAPAAVWAAFAAVLPLLVRGRPLVLDLAGAGVWAAGLVIAHRALGDLLAPTAPLDSPRGAAAGAIVGTLVAVCVAALASAPPRAAQEPAGAG